MRTNNIYRGDTSTENVSRGYIRTAGADINGAYYERSMITPPSQSVGFILRIRPEVLGINQSLAGWINGFTSLVLLSTGQLQMYARREGDTQAVGNVPSIQAIPGLAVGRWMWVYARVTASSAACDYWYSSEDFPTAWNYLGGQLGSNPGSSLTNGNSGRLYIGTRNYTINSFKGDIEYFAEYVDEVVNASFFFRDITSLSATYPDITLESGTTFTPAIAKPKPVERLVHGARQMYPLQRGRFVHKDYTDGGVDSGSHADYNIAGDIDIRWFGTIDDPSIVGFQALIAKWNGPGNDRSWYVNITNYQIQFYMSADGSATTWSRGLGDIPSSLPTDKPFGIRIVRVKSSGTVLYYTSFDGTTWDLKASYTGATADFYASTIGISVGGLIGGWSSCLKGTTEWAEVRSGVDGTVVYRIGPLGIKYYPPPLHTTAIFPEVGSTWPQIKANCDVEPHVPKLGSIYNGDERVWPAEDGYVTTSNALSTNNYMYLPSSVTRWSVDLRPGFTAIACIRKKNAGWTEANQGLINCPGSFHFYTGLTGWGDLGVRAQLLISYNNGSQYYWGWSDPLPDVTDRWLFIGVVYQPDYATNVTRLRFFISYDGKAWIPWRSPSISQPADPLSVSANALRLAGGTYDFKYLSLRHGFGTDATIDPSPGTNEKVTLDRETFRVGRRATTLLTAQEETVEFTRTAVDQLKFTPTVGADPLYAKWGVAQFGDDSRWGP